jgi:hypothetical protein
MCDGDAPEKQLSTEQQFDIGMVVSDGRHDTCQSIDALSNLTVFH